MRLSLNEETVVQGLLTTDGATPKIVLNTPK